MSLNPAREMEPVDRSWNLDDVPVGGSEDFWLPMGESYTGIRLQIPIRVLRGTQPGPTVGMTAALHGDEINGTGAIRELAVPGRLKPVRGTLIMVPVLNVASFDRHSRYLPDRRDLNRSFPGSPGGSSAARVAHEIFRSIVRHCDYLIDLHTAAVRRTNYPQVRADMSNPTVAAMATAFGTEVIVDCTGVPGTLRREATKIGCPTIILEGGEVWKVEPTIVDVAVRGIENVLRHLNVIDGEIVQPDKQVTLTRTSWVRAEYGGFLNFHVRPGDVVTAGQPLATNTDLLGGELPGAEPLVSPFAGVVIGMTTIPSVAPGQPVCHIGRMRAKDERNELRQNRKGDETLESRTVEDLSSNVRVVQP